MTREQVWLIFLNPHMNFIPQVNFKMAPANGDGPAIPAHFPSLSDCHPLPESFVVLLKWHLADDVLRDRKLLPDYLMPLIDPEPVLDFQQLPHYIRTETEHLKVTMASFTDAFVIAKLPLFPTNLHIKVSAKYRDNIPSQHTAVIDPFSRKFLPQAAPRELVPAGLFMVCWNVRGVARPSFRHNFHRIYESHRPAIFLLFEIRNTVASLSEIVSNLPGSYGFSHSAIVGHSGGVAVLWRSEDLSGASRYRDPGFDDVLDIVIQGNPYRKVPTR